MGHRPIVFDLTHLVSRLNRCATTGIDRVDLAYARHFIGRRRAAIGTHYGAFTPHIISPGRARGLVHLIAKNVGDNDLRRAQGWSEIREWLCGRAPLSSIMPELSAKSSGQLLRQTALRVLNEPPFVIPKHAIYINVAQSGFEHHQMFRWLDRRSDVTTVFFVHDLLPLDHPTLFRQGYRQRFERRVDTIVRHADGIICASVFTRDRLWQEYHRRSVEAPPIAVCPFPSPLGGRALIEEIDGELAEHPYFVVAGTLEPRKGHAMLLDAWRHMPEENRPKLVMVGAPGWGVEELLKDFPRWQTVQRSVVRLSGLPRRTLRRLIVNARALLLPSLAEGYGLPIAEALTLGTPVIASDLPVFRETSQSKAEYIGARNISEWIKAIEDYSSPGSARWQAAKVRASEYVPPTRDGYFKTVSDFLTQL